MTAIITRYKISVEQYQKMIRTGVIKEDEPIELIRGEIVEKMTIGPAHIVCVNRLNYLLVRALGERGIVSIQNPVELADSMPQPDIVVFRPRKDFYQKRSPRTSDVCLAIEVADTSLLYDRTVKMPLYAENLIRELWIVNLIDRAIEVYRQPRRSGTYRDVQHYGVGDQIALNALPEIRIGVADVVTDTNLFA